MLNAILNAQYSMLYTCVSYREWPSFVLAFGKAHKWLRYPYRFDFNAWNALCYTFLWATLICFDIWKGTQVTQIPRLWCAVEAALHISKRYGTTLICCSKICASFTSEWLRRADIRILRICRGDRDTLTHSIEREKKLTHELFQQYYSDVTNFFFLGGRGLKAVLSYPTYC